MLRGMPQPPPALPPPTVTPGAQARLASPAIVAALALHAELCREAVLVYAAQVGSAGPYDTSVAADAAVQWVAAEIASYVGGGYPIAVSPPKVKEDAAPLHVGCDRARLAAYHRLISVLPAPPQPATASGEVMQ
jgi:hypothetical protein